MKPRLAAFSLMLMGQAFCQETAHVVGPITDGTPPPPPPPPPPTKLDVRPADVVESKTRDLGARKITVKKILPFELPAQEPARPKIQLTEQQLSDLRAKAQARRERAFLMMSVTVFRSEQYAGSIRTQFRWWSQDRTREFEAWSNIDGNWLSGFGEFTSGNKQYCMMFGISELNVDSVRVAIEA